MKNVLLLAASLLTLPVVGQEYKIAVIGMVHSHVWGHLGQMVKGDPAKLVGVAETIPDLVAEAKRRGVADNLFYSDPVKMLDQAKPNIVWAFVENNRHLDIVKLCAPRGIHVIFEKPLAASYKDSVAIRDLARKHNIRVMTNYQMAWWAANYDAKAAVDSGALGRVWRLRGIVGHGGPGEPKGLNKYFFDWLTDPAKNGAGALMDFGCYNALWSLWYFGKPETVYAQVNQLRPETFPKVEDNSTMVLHYKDKVGIFEGSWDLPRSFQDLEIFGINGSIHMQNGHVELQKSGSKNVEQIPLTTLPPERAEPIAAMIYAIRNNKPIEGLTALDINVDVVQIIEAAERSIKSGQAVKLQ